MPRPGEPYWLPSDTVAALEWQAEQDRRCSSCGQHLDESMDKDNAFSYKAEALWCHGCRAIHRASTKLAGQTKENPLAGSRYRVWRDQASTNGES